MESCGVEQACTGIPTGLESMHQAMDIAFQHGKTELGFVVGGCPECIQ